VTQVFGTHNVVRTVHHRALILYELFRLTVTFEDLQDSLKLRRELPGRCSPSGR
jgi:hypothetical protein